MIFWVPMFWFQLMIFPAGGWQEKHNLGGGLLLWTWQKCNVKHVYLIFKPSFRSHKQLLSSDNFISRLELLLLDLISTSIITKCSYFPNLGVYTLICCYACWSMYTLLLLMALFLVSLRVLILLPMKYSKFN